MIKHLKGLNITVKKLLSDNGPQFRGKKYLKFCSEVGIKKIFTTTYNPPGNPVERVLRDLGDKFRLILNNPENQTTDHASWDAHIRKVVFTLNNTPKCHGYTPSDILGIGPFAPLRKLKILPRVRNLVAQIKKEIDKITLNTKSYQPSFHTKRNMGKCPFDHKGYVNVWTDAATKKRSDDAMPSAVGYWFAPGHPDNRAVVLDPPIKNNRAETLAITMALCHLITNKVSKMMVHTDPQYFADLHNGGYLVATNPNIYKYENSETLEFFLGLEEKLKIRGVSEFKLQVIHVPGHSVDFGNLETDWEVGWIINKYTELMSLLNAQISDLRKLQRYIYIDRHFRHSYNDHQHALRDPKRTTYAKGDIVAIKNHALSAAGYGLTSKFMARYKGRYLVTGQLTSSVYFLEDLDDQNASPVASNIRQMILLQKRGQPQNIRLIEQRQMQCKCASIKAAQAGNTRRAL